MKSIKILIIITVIALSTASCGFVRNELGLGDKSAIQFNDLSVSQADMDADFEALAGNEVLVEMFGEAQEGQEPFIVEGELSESFRMSWANFQLQNLAIREALIESKMEINDEDREKAKEEVKTQFAEPGSPDAEKIWEAFDASFKERLIEGFSERNALLRTAEKVTDEEARAAFEENNAEFTTCETGISTAQILVKTLEEANEIKAALDTGGDFAELAAEKSTDPGSKENGGEYGCLIAGQFIPEYENAARALGGGEISGPVESQFGFHIIRANAFVVPTFEDAKDRIVAGLEPEKQQAIFEKVSESLKTAKITVDEKYGKIIDQDGTPTIVPLDAPDPEEAPRAPEGEQINPEELQQEAPQEMPQEAPAT